MTAASSHADDTHHHDRASFDELERCFEELGGDAPGPTTMIFAAIHGNEPGGVVAVQRAFARIRARNVKIRGRVRAYIGNPPALREGARHIDADLNRAFLYELTHDGIRFTPAVKPGQAEFNEMEELLDAIRGTIAERDRRWPVYAVDLHTFSADGAPFVIYSDTLRNRQFAEHLPVPEILGLAEQMPGTLTDYLTVAGCISIVFESGRHDDEASVDYHEAGIRLMLQAAGHVDAEDLPELSDDRRALSRAVRNGQQIPNVMDVQVRHGLEPGHDFCMKPGFQNFSAVTAGQHVADNGPDRIGAERSGRLLLPLYQKQGSDGYFIARPIGRFWLRCSSFLRWIRIHRFAHFLPGVRQHPDVPEALIVDQRVARFVARDVFHLLGYRLAEIGEKALVVTRRPHDLHDPDEIEV